MIVMSQVEYLSKFKRDCGHFQSDKEWLHACQDNPLISELLQEFSDAHDRPFVEACSDYSKLKMIICSFSDL